MENRFSTLRIVHETVQKQYIDLLFPTLGEGPPIDMFDSFAPSLFLLPDRRTFIRIINKKIKNIRIAQKAEGEELSGEVHHRIDQLCDGFERLRGLAAGQQTMPFFR